MGEFGQMSEHEYREVEGFTSHEDVVAIKNNSRDGIYGLVKYSILSGAIIAVGGYATATWQTQNTQKQIRAVVQSEKYIPKGYELAKSMLLVDGLKDEQITMAGKMYYLEAIKQRERSTPHAMVFEAQRARDEIKDKTMVELLKMVREHIHEQDMTIKDNDIVKAALLRIGQLAYQPVR